MFGGVRAWARLPSYRRAGMICDTWRSAAWVHESHSWGHLPQDCESSVRQHCTSHTLLQICLARFATIILLMRSGLPSSSLALKHCVPKP